MSTQKTREAVGEEIAKWFVQKMTTGLPGALSLADAIIAITEAECRERERRAFLVGAHEEGGGDKDWEEYIEAEALRRYGEVVK